MDTTLAYQAIKHALTIQQQHASFPVSAWYHYGYIPYEVETSGASWTLELSYDSWVASNTAKALGFNQDYQIFLNASQNWKNVFDPEYKFFCPKTTTGKWECPPTWINVFDDRYTEGDAWHYRFYVPGNVSGLISLFGKDDFVSQLEDFMYDGEFDPTNYLPNPYYWAGNEPDLLSVYEFNFAGRPDLTQRYLRWLLENEYTVLPSGLPGNDDYGAMSAWYIWGVLGVYPLSGSTTFMMGSPIFDSVQISLPGGNFIVKAYNASPENIYVEKISLNGKPIDLKNSFLDWMDIKKGCLIEFWMSPNQPHF